MNPVWMRRLVTVGLLGMGIVLALAGSAAAADGGESDRNAFSWIDIEDSNGVPVWKYALDFDEGGWTSPGKSFWASIIGFMWGLYKIVVLIPLWLLDWVLQMSWIQILSTPALILGDAMQQMVDQFGLTRVFLMVTVMVAGLMVFRGRVATGIYEICASMIMAALALGLLAQPVQLIAGPGGWLEQTHRAGLEISVTLSNASTDEKLTTDQLREQQMAMLADVFVSKPYQVVNFGQVLDGECEAKYAEAMRDKEFGQAPEARDAIEDCDEDAAEYASNPSSEAMVPVWVFVPGAAAIMVLSMMVAGAVLLAGANAIFQSIKLVLTLLTGLLPGKARGPVWATFANTLVALALVVGCSAFLGGFIVMVRAIFDRGAEDNLSPLAAFAMVDVVLIVGAIVFWQWRRQVSRAAGRLAEAMSTRPGGGGQATARAPRSVMPYAMKAAHLGSALAMHRAVRQNNAPTAPAVTDGKPKPAETGPATGRGPGAATPRPAIDSPTRRQLTAGPLSSAGAATPPSHPSGAGASPALNRAKSSNTARKAMTGAQVGAAALSGGTSAAASLAAKKAAAAAGKGAVTKAAASSVSATRRASVVGQLGSNTSASTSGVHRPTPLTDRSPQKFDRVVKNGRVVLVPSQSSDS